MNGRNTIWRNWLVKPRLEQSKEHSLSDRFEIIERIERKWEKWMKRAAKAKREDYTGAGLNRQQKRQCWYEAKSWFEAHQEQLEGIMVRHGEVGWPLVWRSFCRWLEAMKNDIGT